MPRAHPSLLLASTSRYRREQLERLHLQFHVARPEVDETPLPRETAGKLAARLARAKAQAIATRQPGSWVIGSDQAAELGRQILGKPGTRAAAIAQLRMMSGQKVRFRTGVCLLRGDNPVEQQAFEALDTTTVQFRELDDAEIERYVDAEQPLDCAGSFKSEGLGISLFDAIESKDPTALIGLPLIALCGMLRQAGFALP